MCCCSFELNLEGQNFDFLITLCSKFCSIGKKKKCLPLSSYPYINIDVKSKISSTMYIHFQLKRWIVNATLFSLDSEEST